MGPVHGAAVGQGPVAEGQLERGHLEVALADGDVQVVAPLPAPAAAAELPVQVARPGAVGLPVLLPEPPAPLAGRDRALGPVGQVDGGPAPEPELPGGGLELLVDLLALRLLGLLGQPELGAQVVVVDVAGQPQAVGQADRAVAPGRPVPLGVAAEGERAGAAVGAGGRDDAGLEAGQGGERLPGRAGRVGRLDGPVQQRLARVARVAGEVAPRDAADEAPRVVLGQAGQDEQGTVVGVEDDRGGGRGRVGAAPFAVGQPPGGPHAVGQGPLNTHLEVEVEGELEVAAGGRWAATEGPYHLPSRVDLEVLDAVAAPEPLVVGQLDPGLADDVAGRVSAEPLGLDLVG